MSIKAVYCAGTHWDREWYEPFQEFRMWLVELIDELITLLETNPDYRCFHLDGQAVVLRDYLEIRPERRDTLTRLLKEGRLIAGPWYVLPDEWLVSGESFVRNIMMGMQAVRELGAEPMDFGYTPDQFGHIAALPMILTGFGLQAGICWRGAQDENFPAHFIWVGPDGSRMPTHKLPDNGAYAPFLFLVRAPATKEGLTDEALRAHFEPFFAREQARDQAKTGVVLMLDAIDHQRPDHAMPDIFDRLKRFYPETEFVWGSLADYAREMVKSAAAFPEYRGELREPCRAADRGGQYLIVHVISSRYPVKKRNDECQAMLEKWAEPYALFQRMAGGAPILRYLEVAWDYLIKNHPHDSICGCSVDQVHRDMQYRFDQSALIADGLLRRAMAGIAAAAANDAALRHVAVHNPLPFARTGVFELSVPFPRDWAKRYTDGLTSGEPIDKFILTDREGNRVPFQIRAVERNVTHRRLQANGRREAHQSDLYHLAVEMTLPACGYTGVEVAPTDEATRNFGGLMTGPLSASNGCIAFTLRPDGTGTLAQCGSGTAYAGLFLYEDCGDAGDGWTRGPLLNDVVFRSPGTNVSTAIEEDGPLRTVFRVERTFLLPREMDRRTWWRSEERTALDVTDRIFVEKGAACLRIRTRVRNTCKDHRFRVLFPTGIDSPVSFAETPFALVERPIAIPEETKTWQERVNPEKAFTTFFGISNGEGGLAVLAPSGLHEYEVLQTPEHTLALTLFRSTFQTVGTSGEPDGELLGEWDFEYFLLPFRGAFDPVQAARIVSEAQAGIRTHASESFPETRSFLELVHGTVIATAIKVSADGKAGVIRLWNPGPVDAIEVIRLDVRPTSAQRCMLDETPRAELALEDNGNIPVLVPAGGLETVRFTW